jgi:hypothetical protein
MYFKAMTLASAHNPTDYLPAAYYLQSMDLDRFTCASYPDAVICALLFISESN